MKNLGCVQVPDPCDRSLIKQCHLDFTSATVQSRAKGVAIHGQRIRTNFFAPQCSLKFHRVQQSNGSQTSSVPKRTDGSGLPIQVPLHANVVCIRGIGQQHQAGHARLNYNRILAIELQNESFSEAIDAHDGAIFDVLPEDHRRGGNGDWLEPRRRKLHIDDGRIDNRENSPPHGLDFRKLRHLVWRGESTPAARGQSDRSLIG
jgi:hypothetical protein